MMFKNFSATNLNECSKYVKLNLNNCNISLVSKANFSDLKWPCFTYQGYLVKFTGGTRESAVTSMKLILREWKPQSLWSDLKDVFSVIKVVCNTVSSCKQVLANLDIPTLMTHLGEFALSLLSALNNGDWLSVANLTFKVYNLYLFIMNAQIPFVSQGFEEISVALIGAFLPKKIQDLVKQMQIFSSTKLLDDPLVLQKFFNSIADLFEFTDDRLGFIMPKFVREWCENLRGMTSKFIHLRNIKTLLGESARDPKIIVDPLFAKKVVDLHKSLSVDVSYNEYVRKSNYAKVMWEKFEMLNKSILSHKDIARCEPTAFILEGGPGTGKSTFMVKLLSLFDEPAYSHIVKPTDDSKDFYDTYQGEKIFYMDDVGQMSNSQWRTLINIVSCAKLPLACADAKLKNTKYFSSDIILATTNSFIDLNSFVRSDGISDVGALKRRGYVFDMRKMKFISGFYTGEISFKHYDLRTHQFIEAFPPHFKKYLIEKGKTLEVRLENPSEDEMLLWAYSIIRYFDMMKEEFKVSNTLSQDRIKMIQNLFEAQNNEDGDEELSKILYERFKIDPIWIDMVKDLFTSSLTKFSSCIGAVIDQPWLFSCLGLLLSVIPYLICKCLGKKQTYTKQSGQTLENVKSKLIHLSSSHSLSQLISKQTLYMELQMDDGVIFKTLGVVSGHKIILPSHSIIGSNGGYISVFSLDGTGCLIDNMRFSVEFRCEEEDVAVLSLPTNIPAYFKNLSKALEHISESSSRYTLGALGKVASVSKTVKMRVDSPVIYRNDRYAKEFRIHSVFPYDIQEQGLCGAIITNEHGKMLGMHVAGNEIADVGVSVMWSKNVLTTLYNLLCSDDKFLSDIEIKQSVGTSGFKLDRKEYKSAITKSDFVPSPLYGVFPVCRAPAVLDVEGRHTIKTFAKKACDKTYLLDIPAFNFAKDAIQVYLEDFSDLTELEVVKGNEWLAPLNKDSANGYKCDKDKLQYVDFEKGELTQRMKEELYKMEQDIKLGVYVDDDWIWEESLKDELRNLGKHLKPRTFRVARMHNQVLMKRIFGNMVVNIMKNRRFNQIMIGVNPFVEWDEIYSELLSCKGVWAGDIGSYDGHMLPQVQEAVHDLLCKYYKGQSPELCSFLLRDMYNTSVVVNDDLWRTTHSMPSGSYLTAIVNSLVNRFYTLMWYYNNTEKPSVSHFCNSVVDYVYGDDKLNGVRDVVGVTNLNAITMEKFFESIGMTFTTASKQKIVAPFESINEVSFLKRYFRYHPLIKRVMCPLELNTLESGLSWINSKKSEEVVLNDKIATFQREMFLHSPDKFAEYTHELRNKCKEVGIPFRELPRSYLIKVFSDESECLKGLSWGGSQYM